MTSIRTVQFVYSKNSLPAGDAGGIADQSVGELYGKIMSLQAEMDNMAETANKLLDDKEQKQKHMDVINKNTYNFKIGQNWCTFRPCWSK